MSNVLRLVRHARRRSENIDAEEFRRRMYAGTGKLPSGSMLEIEATDPLTGEVKCVRIDAGTLVEFIWWEQ